VKHARALKTANYETAAMFLAHCLADIDMVPSFRTLPVTLTNSMNKFKMDAYERLYDEDYMRDVASDGPGPVFSEEFLDRS
jgi:hypothetical protein